MDSTIKNIIFDFDGTLADTLPLILATMHEVTGRMALPELTDEQCKSVIGIKLEEAPPALWGEGRVDIDNFVKVYRKVFEELRPKFQVQCFPDVPDTLKELHYKGYGMAIASSRNRKSLGEYLEELGIDKYFCCIIGADDVTEGKPSPQPVNKILSQKGWKPDETITVGDMGVDILMGNRAGTKTCGVTYGNGTRIDLSKAGANHIIDNFASLLSIV